MIVWIYNILFSETVENDYWVVITDYDNYALMYGCREWGADDVCEQVYSFVWSRETSLSDSHQQLVDNKIAELCVNTTFSVAPNHAEGEETQTVNR